jgi:hypothetical protein
VRLHSVALAKEGHQPGIHTRFLPDWRRACS